MKFDNETVSKIKNIFAHKLGISVNELEIIRIGQNLMLDIPTCESVLRVYRNVGNPAAKAQMEVEFAETIAKLGIPSIQPSYKFNSAILKAGDYTSTVWKRLEKDTERVNAQQFGKLLHDIHLKLRGEPPELLKLERIDPLAKIRSRLNRLSHDKILDDKKNELLLSYLSRCEVIWSNFQSELPNQPIHGDAHTGNVILSNGIAHICDFDCCCIGPIEWDLVPIHIIARRFRNQQPDILNEFKKEYKISPAMEINIQKLLPLRELSMVSWLAQDITNDPKRTKELENRIHSLSETNEPFTAWNPN